MGIEWSANSTPGIRLGQSALYPNIGLIMPKVLRLTDHVLTHCGQGHPPGYGRLEYLAGLTKDPNTSGMQPGKSAAGSSELADPLAALSKAAAPSLAPERRDQCQSGMARADFTWREDLGYLGAQESAAAGSLSRQGARAEVGDALRRVGSRMLQNVLQNRAVN